MDNAIWKRCWLRLAVKLSIWYAMPSGLAGARFTAILAAEWRGLLRRTWNSEMTLVFAHIFLIKTLGVRRAREIRSRITRRINLWDICLHAGLVGDA